METIFQPSSSSQAGPVSPSQAPVTSTSLADTSGKKLHYQSTFLTPLPKTRTKPLPYGKELQSRRWIDDRLTHIRRRYVRKYGLPEDNGDLEPYTDIGELCTHVDEVVNFLWSTATPVLQTQYLLQISHDLISTYVPNFTPPSPVPIFSLLRKLDHCFASMLAGKDIETGEELAAVSHSDGKQLVTLTDMVRLKGIVEHTRVDIVSIFLGEYENDDLHLAGENNRTPKKMKEVRVEDDDYDEDEVDDMDGDTEVEMTDTEVDAEEREPELDEALRMDIARVYDNTVVQLGNALGGAGELGKGISDELGVGESYILQDQNYGYGDNM